MRLFGGSDTRSGASKVSARILRVSSGWSNLLKLLQAEEGQRILDIGPTSPTNINFLTGLGHSIYMANLVGEATDAKWARADSDTPFPAADFLKENLEFNGRQFDIVLLWDTLDYLESTLSQAVVSRLHEVLVPGGSLLAFFHSKPETGLNRYHLRDDGQVEAQMTSDIAVLDILNNRQIEKIFGAFSNHKFFLAKDNLREVIVKR